MNKKFLLAAMALPMLFTACSQDELFEGIDNGANTPKVKGYDVVLNPSLGGLNTSRALWDDTYAKLTWEKTDLMSVYWLENQASSTNALQGKFNSIFKTTDGNAFTSEALVFEGGNIAVFPGNTAFTSQGNIYLTVDTLQDASTIKKTPYISNYLNVSAASVEAGNPNQTEQIAGYNNGLYAPMKMAANVLYLNIELANTEDLAQYNFAVESVELVAKSAETTKTKAFGKKASLVIDGTPYDVHKVHSKDKSGQMTKADSVNTILKSVKTSVAELDKTATLTSTAIEDKGNGKYQVKFVVLPTDYVPAAGYSEIVINTNCGRINLTTTKKTGDAAAVKMHAYTAPTENETNVVWSGLVTGGVDAEGNAYTQTIDSLFQQVLASRTMEAGQVSNFIGEKVGRPYARTIKADMANATLNDSKVYNSEQILSYIAIHTAMKNDKPMNLILSTKEENGTTFKSLTAAAIKAIDGKNTYPAAGVTSNILVTLSMDEGMDAVQIVGGGGVYFNNDMQWKSGQTEVKMVLEAGKNWTMDDNYNFNKVSEIINNGTLTIAGTAKDGSQRTLTEKIINNGTVEIGGNNKLQVGNNLVNVSTKDVTGVVNVKAGQDLVFNADVTEGIAGEINVAQGAFMTIAKDKNVTSEAVINNYGTVSSVAGNGGLTNEGKINILRNGAIAYVQENGDGEIVLLSRNNEVKVYGNKGKIVYNYNSGADGEIFKRTVSDKFTYVVFGSGNGSIALYNGDGKMSLDDISMEFTSETILKANGETINDLKVANGAHLQLLTPEIGYTNTLNAHCVLNEGNITIGGIIYYSNSFTDNGTVRSVGDGAIVYAPVSVEDVATLKSAIAANKGIKLTGNLSLAETLVIPVGYTGTIDLNNSTLTTSSTAAGTDDITVNGELTVKNGTISSANTALFIPQDSNGKLTLDECNVSTNHSEFCAVAAFGGELIVKGGNYTNTATAAAGDGNANYVIGVVNAKATLTNVTVSSTVQGGLTVLGNSSVTVDGGSYNKGANAPYEYGLFVNADGVGTAVVTTKNNPTIGTHYYEEGTVNGVNYRDNAEVTE